MCDETVFTYSTASGFELLFNLLFVLGFQTLVFNLLIHIFFFDKVIIFWWNDLFRKNFTFSTLLEHFPDFEKFIWVLDKF